jgi:hypothetical protein
VLFGRAGERPLLVAEQRRLDEVLRDRAAVDRDERLRAALARAVNGARDQLLADAGFALDQHRDQRGRGLLGHAQHVLHPRVACDDVAKRKRAAAAALQPLEFGFERTRRQCVAQRDLQPLGADRLHHEIGRAGAHRRDDLVDAAMGGLHDHRNAQSRIAHPREHAVSVEVGHHQVEHHAVDARRVRTGQRRDRGVPPVCGHDLVAEARRHGFEQAALHRVVIDDQDGFGHATLPTGNCTELGRTLADGD